VFSIEVPLSAPGTQPPRAAQPSRGHPGPIDHPGQSGTLLVVEDDPEVRELLLLLLQEDGHRVAAAADGDEALKLVRRGTVRPDLMLADYNLPNGMSGLQLAAKLRAELHRKLPVIILTGDISSRCAPPV
jgi:two-component system CheB/CheR fusion protein